MGASQTVVAAAAALLGGIFIGGIGPRAELGRTKAALVEAEAKARAASNPNALALMLGVGGLAAAQNGSPGPGSGEAKRPPRFVPTDPPPAPPMDAGTEDGSRRRREFSREQFAAARAAAEIRAAEHRAAFVEAAELGPGATATLDATIKSFNDELKTTADEVVRELEGRLARQTTIHPRDVIDLGARFLDVYRRADDRFLNGLDREARAAADRSDFDLLSQVDIGALEGVAETMRKLPDGVLRGQRGSR